MEMFVGMLIGGISGLLTGFCLHSFIYEFCELDHIIIWLSCVCYIVPFFAGLAAGYDVCIWFPHSVLDIFGIFGFLWDILKIIIKVVFPAIVIALIAVVIAVIIELVNSGAIFIMVIFVAVVIAATTPIIRIIIEF